MNDIAPQPKAIDGVVRRSPMQQQAVAAPVAHLSVPVTQRRTFAPPQPPKTHRFWRRLQLPLVISAGICGGIFIQNMLVGGILTTGYGLAALILRMPSRNTFALALLSIGAVCALLLFKPNGELISNFSSYAFIFLIFGVLSLGRESRLPKRQHYSKRRR